MCTARARSRAAALGAGPRRRRGTERQRHAFGGCSAFEPALSGSGHHPENLTVPDARRNSSFAASDAAVTGFERTDFGARAPFGFALRIASRRLTRGGRLWCRDSASRDGAESGSQGGFDYPRRCPGRRRVHPGRAVPRTWRRWRTRIVARRSRLPRRASHRLGGRSDSGRRVIRSRRRAIPLPAASGRDPFKRPLPPILIASPRRAGASRSRDPGDRTIEHHWEPALPAARGRPRAVPVMKIAVTAAPIASSARPAATSHSGRRRDAREDRRRGVASATFVRRHVCSQLAPV